MEGPVFVDLQQKKKKTESKGRCGQMLSDGDAESSLSKCECYWLQFIFKLFSAILQDDKMILYFLFYGL